jgi:hypothetical protein
MFTIISCFEVALRNTIDKHYKSVLGEDWLRDAASAYGVLNNPRCGKTPLIIDNAVREPGARYSHLRDTNIPQWENITYNLSRQTPRYP